MTSRHELTLHEKVQLIYDSSDGNGLSQCKLAEKYNISLDSDYETNQNQTVKRKSSDVNVQKLDEQVYEWFVQQRAKGIPISGPILQEQARDIAESLGDQFASFKGSNGCGESSSVDVQTVDDWIQRLPKITDGYDAKNIFNCDETALFFKAMPDKSLTFNKEECKGRKKSKERVTILFCVSSIGEKLKPLVIGKSLKPRCFRNLNPSKLPVD
ncbi:unnamed protein product [Rotaria sordida]|uniref:HTH CENPB-type domain-containing protein n=1 Tax=Rotaria sordida TaxID=392033 RepID=A0A819XR82_9BILA|nr:unnamed protein product [Rotaria sordida]